MMPNTYLYEKVAQAHHEDLQREAEQKRMLASLPQHRSLFVRHGAARLGRLLVSLGTSLQAFGVILR